MKREKRVVNLAGLEVVASIKNLIDVLEAANTTLEAEFKSKPLETSIAPKNSNAGSILKELEAHRSRLAEEYLGKNCTFREDPEGDFALASLIAAEISETAPLQTNGISSEINETTDGTYVINCSYAADQTILKKVSMALRGVEGLPEDFILYQPKNFNETLSVDTISHLFLQIRKIIEKII